MAKLLYGIRKIDGSIIGISEIPIGLKERKKEEWECLCPHCGALLIPKKGNENQHHFAHKAKECNISYATQTVLHRMAKEIILEEKKIMTPSLKISFEELGICDVPEVILSNVPTYEYRKAKTMECTNVYLEKRTSGFVPDITVETEKGECLVEITVTHPTKNNEDKMKKIRELGLPVIEVDLKKYKDSEISRDELRKILIESSEDKEFINYPWKKEAKEKAKEQAKKHYFRNEALKRYVEKYQKRNFPKGEKKELTEGIVFDANNLVFDPNDYTLDIFYQNEKHIVDNRKKRWLLCTSCNQIYTEDDMQSYGGIGTMNQGACHKCAGYTD